MRTNTHQIGFRPPGETIADILRKKEMPRRVSANKMGMTRSETYQLMAGEIEITTRIACQLENAFGLPTAHFWIESERLYRESLAKKA